MGLVDKLNQLMNPDSVEDYDDGDYMFDDGADQGYAQDYQQRTRETKTISFFGSLYPNLRIRLSSGTPPGALAIPVGILNAPASV